MARIDSYLEDKRCSFIFGHIQQAGKVGRADIRDEFKVSAATASAILRRFQEAFPGAITYNMSDRCFERGPRFNFHVKQRQPSEVDPQSIAVGFD